MEKKKDLSIKDIAKQCGVSVSTVSRVLNNTGRCSAATRERIRQVIGESGYRPSVFARGMRTGCLNAVGIIVPDITNEFFSSITLAIQNKLFESGTMTLICNTNERRELQHRQLEMLRASKVSGLIFISGEEIGEEEFADGIPKIFIDRLPGNAAAKKAVTIEVDNYTGGLLAAGEMLHAGCRRIAGLFDGRGLSTKTARYAGFLRAHEEHGIKAVRELHCPLSKISYEEGYRAVKRLIGTGAEFDGIFCYSDLLAYGAIHALAEASIPVPDACLVTGFDNIAPSEFSNPPVTTVEQPVREMGELAAELITRMRNGAWPENNRYVLPVKLIRRKTTERAAARKSAPVL
ncbi:MAG TPA: LacI family transcriptional regulator [Clostridiales bacterium]|nr:LacI family transcriptional regulator [Clostridiales bacterium]